MPTKNYRHTNYHPDIFGTCEHEELQSGRLGRLFLEGKKVAIVKDDHRVSQIWDRLLNPSETELWGGASLTPWNNSVLNLARNHQSGNLDLGDIIRFIPGAIGHIARKFVVFLDDQGQIQTFPERFYIENQCLTLPKDVARMAWDLMSDVWESTLDKQVPPPSYAVTIEILTYPCSSQDYTYIHSLLMDACGGFARVGHQLDTYRAMTMGIFDYRFIREAFALACLIPGFSTLLQNLNSAFKRWSKKKVPDHVELIGEPHTDGIKFLTALAGDRETLTTEIYHQGKWIELPLTTHSLSVFPSEQFSKNYNNSSTIHRVHVKTEEAPSHVMNFNTTLCLAIVPYSEKKDFN